MTLLLERTALAEWDGWEVVELDATSWRICDPSREPDDARRLIAYAERDRAGDIDVLWLSSPAPTVSRFRSLDDAFDAWRGVSDDATWQL